MRPRSIRTAAVTAVTVALPVPLAAGAGGTRRAHTSATRPNRISAGTFHPDEDGRSRVRFAAAVDPRLYPVLIVTAEPGDGDPRPPGPEVLRSRP